MPTTRKKNSKGGSVSMFPKKPADVMKMIKDKRNQWDSNVDPGMAWVNLLQIKKY